MLMYYSGSEVPGWRALLADQGVTDVALSFVGLSRRVKFKRPWIIADKYPEHQRVFLDSGGYSINRQPDKYQRADVEELAETYLAFVAANVDRVELVSELDALHLGPEWLERHREKLSQIAGDKFLPIWHEEYGLDELERLASTYGRVGVPQTSAQGRDIVNVLNRLARRGNKLHGVAMTKIDLMQSVAWDSVASTSWLSPAQYGDSQIWTGNELKRYPKAYKDQGRRRHRQHLARSGFDTDAYEADDVNEVLKVAIWSWQQFVKHINSRKNHIVTMSPVEPTDENVEFPSEEVSTELYETRNDIATRDDAERQVLPGFSVDTVTRSELGENGEKVERTSRHLRVVSASLRQCDSCHLGSYEKCRGYRPGAECMFDIPVTMETLDDVRAARDTVLAIQFQRVAFGRRVEEAEGGYPDPNLTKEIEVFNRMVKARLDEEITEEEITLRARRRGAAQSSWVAQIFGEKPAASRELTAPVDSNDVMAEIVEGDVVE